jgi:L,D-peptidoglycan transpeptidase YkuD (ErfK/YbiS/YcfS/YnhG family)
MITTIPDTVNMIRTSRQLIVVLSDSWNSPKAALYRFERSDAGWSGPLSRSDVVVGSNGMAWGIGLLQRNNGGLMKKEGDRRAPAGIFRLKHAMGYAPASPEGAPYPYEQISEASRCIDDPASALYNRIVNEEEMKMRGDVPWKSAEIMLRKDDLYKWLIVVDHNMTTPLPGEGSCIFLHIRRSPDKGTAGCTAMAEQDLLTLLGWLRDEKNPLLVQLPRAEYEQFWRSWGLPSPGQFEVP